VILPLETQHTGDQNIELLQQNVKKFVKVLEDNPLLDGVLIENITVPNMGTVVVNHKLGRRPRGWILTDKAGNGNIFRGAAWTDKTIELANSVAADCVIAIWVF
jgi:hypothetical protein